MNLKEELHNISKGCDSIDVYLQKIKVVRAKLMAVGMILDDEELLHIAIEGLPKEYNAVKSTIHTRSTQVSFDELTTLLSAEEESLNDTDDVKETFAMTMNATPRPSGYNQYNSKGRGRNSNKGRGNGGGRGSNSFPQQYSPYTSNQNQSNQFSSSSQVQGSKNERPTC